MAAARRSGRLTIFVRFNSNTNIPVTIDPQWTVLRLKQEIATNQGVEASELRIIFAGRELKDDLQLKVCFTVYSVKNSFTWKICQGFQQRKLHSWFLSLYQWSSSNICQNRVSYSMEWAVVNCFSLYLCVESTLTRMLRYLTKVLFMLSEVAAGQPDQVDLAK